jgi:hypothetical protein
MTTEATLNSCWGMLLAVLIIALILLFNTFFVQDATLYLTGPPPAYKSGFVQWGQGSGLAMAAQEGIERGGFKGSGRYSNKKKSGLGAYEPPVFWVAGELATDATLSADLTNQSAMNNAEWMGGYGVEYDADQVASIRQQDMSAHNAQLARLAKEREDAAAAALQKNASRSAQSFAGSKFQVPSPY